MGPEGRSRLRWTVASALLAGGLFFAVSALRAGTQGFRFSEVAGPVSALGAIGAIVGGLIGPLLRSIVSRVRGR